MKKDKPGKQKLVKKKTGKSKSGYIVLALALLLFALGCYTTTNQLPELISLDKIGQMLQQLLATPQMPEGSGALPTEPGATYPVWTDPTRPSHSGSSSGSSTPSKPSNATFAVNSSASTYSYYGFRFTVGTNNGIKLGTIFRVRSGKTIDNTKDIVVTLSDEDRVLSTLTLPAGDSRHTNWQNQTITIPSGISKCKISIINATSEASSLTVKVVSGAYNVATVEEWKAVPDGASIAVLKSIKLPATNLTAMKSGAGQIPKNLGNKTIYGNLRTISVPTFTVKSTDNSYFVAGSGATLQNVIIEGPVYGTNFSVTDEDGPKKGTFVSGVKAGSITIKNSYISGFRQPLATSGGTVTISNSVLKGGNFANLYVYGNTTFKLTNVTTVQNEEKGAIGVGIFINNTAPSNTFQVSGFNQYTFLTRAQIQTFIKRAVGEYSSMVSITNDDVSKIAQVKHGEHYHCGIVVCGDNSKMSSVTGGNLGTIYVRSSNVSKGFLAATFNAAFYGRPSCGNCAHSISTSYSVSDFLATR